MLYKHFFIFEYMSKIFITKYKPKTISEFTNDHQFTSIIETLNKVDNLNLLLIGGSSIGKTTLLNCIVRDYYNLTNNQHIPDTNTLFINSLKEQGIQYFRNEMKTFCQSRSSIFGKKKLVIIDDIDIINDQGQQVFRNYIDKYSKNIHFICACTNIQKVIESLQSRLHIIKIPKPSNDYINSVMNKIIINEHININNDIKKYLLMSSENSIRIIINYLEKIYLYNDSITLEECKKICSTISNYHFDNYYQYLNNNQSDEAIKILYNIHDQGYSVIDILDFLFKYTKNADNIKETDKYNIIQVLCNYITIFHNVHEDCIELALLTNNIYNIIK